MRKRIITTAIVFLFVTGIAVATSPDIASAGSKRLLSIATASTGGSWYPAGGAIGSLITKYIPNTEASAHPSAASRENIRLLQEKGLPFEGLLSQYETRKIFSQIKIESAAYLNILCSGNIFLQTLNKFSFLSE